MILLDTNVLIYASDPNSEFFDWARETIASGVAGGGVGINAIALAEICVGEAEPGSLPTRLGRWGLVFLDLPYAASMICAEAYKQYCARRLAESATAPPKIPLPDFFIGAHCQLMDWKLATADLGRFRTYFPTVELVTPTS